MTDTTCPICKASFTSESGIRDHTWDVHGACHYCGAKFDDEATVYTHWLAVHEDELSRLDQRRAEAEVGTVSFRDRLIHQGPVGALTGIHLSRRGLIGGGLAGFAGLIGGAFAIDPFGRDKSGRSGGSSIASHPAATALESQPILGPSPSTADGTIIAFEDPSCPSCARFEREVFPQLKSQLIDAGTVSFVFRGIPVILPWGEIAILALEATYAHDEEAFWALKQFYYHAQNQIGDENITAKTRQFLANQTDVDVDAVLQDSDQATYQDAVDTDLQAAQNAGVRGTPTFFLFKEGAYVTDVIGPQSYEVFKNSLGV